MKSHISCQLEALNYHQYNPLKHNARSPEGFVVYPSMAARPPEIKCHLNYLYLSSLFYFVFVSFLLNFVFVGRTHLLVELNCSIKLQRRPPRSFPFPYHPLKGATYRRRHSMTAVALLRLATAIGKQFRTLLPV